MKIIYLNIYKGAFEEDRFEKLIDFINSQNPDILALTELNNWEKDNFKKLNYFKDKTNFKFSFFSKSNTNYNLGVFSKFEINSSESYKKEFWHSLLNINIKNVNIYLTHLDPKLESDRLSEIKVILNQIKKNLDENKEVVLLGDLNSLSPLDKYDSDELLKKLKSINSEKFGKTKLRFEVQNEILNSGLIDVIKENSTKFEYTVPTNYNEDISHLDKLRLDYIFVSKNLARKIKNAKVLRNKETNQLSDHFPLIVEIKS